MKIKSITAWAVVKNNKLDASEIYKDKDVILSTDEIMVKVEIRVL